MRRINSHHAACRSLSSSFLFITTILHGIELLLTLDLGNQTFIPVHISPKAATISTGVLVLSRISNGYEADYPYQPSESRPSIMELDPPAVIMLEVVAVVICIGLLFRLVVPELVRWVMERRRQRARQPVDEHNLHPLPDGNASGDGHADAIEGGADGGGGSGNGYASGAEGGADVSGESGDGHAGGTEGGADGAGESGGGDGGS